MAEATATRRYGAIAADEIFNSSGTNLFVPDLIARPATTIITVGDGGDYETLSEAISRAYIIKTKALLEGWAIEIRLLSGYVVREQISLAFYDLSHARITSEDDVVMCDTSVMTGVSKSMYTSRFMFAALQGAFFPIISAQFEAMDSGPEVVAFFASKASKIHFEKDGEKVVGGRNFAIGFHSDYQSNVVVRDTNGEPTRINQGGKLADFSGSRIRAIQCYCSGNFSAPSTDLTGSGIGVYLIYGSRGDCLFADASNCTDTGFSSRDSCELMARSTYAANCVNYGYYTVHAAGIDARSHSTDENDDDDSNADGCGIGAHAGFGCRIEISGHSLKNSKRIAIRAYGSSNVCARSTDISGSAKGIELYGTANIDAEDLVATGLTVALIKAKGASTASLENSKCATDKNGSGDTYYIESGNQSRVNLSGADIRNQKQMVASEQGQINVTGALWRGQRIYALQDASILCRSLVWESIVAGTSDNVSATTAAKISVHGMTVRSGTLKYSTDTDGQILGR